MTEILQIFWYCRLIFYLALPSPPSLPATAPPEAWAALKYINVVAEIAGPHENYGSSFATEFKYTWTNWRDLQGTPPVTDASRLPPAYPRWVLAEQHVGCLERWRLSAEWRWQDHAEALERSRLVRNFWDKAKTAQSESGYWVSRRKLLAELRSMMTDQAWAEGRRPLAGAGGDGIDAGSGVGPAHLWQTHQLPAILAFG